MKQDTPVRALFDADEDVLYVSLGAPVPSFVDEDPSGLLYRYAYDGEQPSGVTVIGFAQCWATKRDALYHKIAGFLHADRAAVEKAIADGVRT